MTIYATYGQAARALQELTENENQIWRDGATDWDLVNLIEAIDDKDDDVEEMSPGGYVIDDEGITIMMLDGYRGQRILWKSREDQDE